VVYESGRQALLGGWARTEIYGIGDDNAFAIGLTPLNDIGETTN